MGNPLRAFDPDGNQQGQRGIQRYPLAAVAHIHDLKGSGTRVDAVI